MPTLIKKGGKPRWRASVMVAGKIKQKIFPDDTKTSYREAVSWESKTKTGMMTTNVTDTASWTVLGWLNEYLDSGTVRLANKTLDEKKGTFRRALDAFSADMLVENISAQAVLKMLEARTLTSGYAANKDRKNLVTTWNWGKKYLPGFPATTNPFLVVDRFPEKRHPRYVPPEDDFWRVYDVAEGQDKIMLFTFLHLAARRNEVFGLQWPDISFHDSRVRLWTSKRQGGDSEADWLPMTSDLKACLMGWWEDRPVRSEHVFVCLDKTAFTQDYYGKPFQYRNHLMNRLCDKAGVKAFGFHAIRHLTASILYREGHPVGVIQAVLRHKSPQTTTRYLQTLGLEQTREALEGVLSKRGPAKILALKKTAPGGAISEG